MRHLCQGECKLCETEQTWDGCNYEDFWGNTQDVEIDAPGGRVTIPRDNVWREVPGYTGGEKAFYCEGTRERVNFNNKAATQVWVRVNNGGSTNEIQWWNGCVGTTSHQNWSPGSRQPTPNLPNTGYMPPGAQANLAGSGGWGRPIGQYCAGFHADTCGTSEFDAWWMTGYGEGHHLLNGWGCDRFCIGRPAS